MGKLGFVGFAKYPKVVQHRAIACWKQLDIPTKNMGAQFWPPPPSEWGGVKRPPGKKIFFGFFFYFFSERGWSVNAKKIFLNFTPTPLRGEESKLKNFDF